MKRKNNTKICKMILIERRRTKRTKNLRITMINQYKKHKQVRKRILQSYPDTIGRYLT